MKVHELISRMDSLDPDATVSILVYNLPENFSISWGGSEGEMKGKSKQVYLCVDRLCSRDIERGAIKEEE